MSLRNRFVLRNFKATGFYGSSLRLCLAIFVSQAFLHTVSAQGPYTVDPIIDQSMTNNRTMKDRERLIRDILRGRKPYSGNEQAFEKWYKEYYFPQMTATSELENLASIRKELIKFLVSSKAPAAHDALNQLLLQAMTDFAKSGNGKNYHPALRFNAMLIISDLNSKEGVRSGIGRALAQPLPAALDAMLAELESTEQIDAVKVAALIGILRHVELDAVEPAIPAATKTKITDQALALAKSNKASAKGTKDGHFWMRRQAIEILGAMGSAGPGGSAAEALSRIIQDRDSSIALRCSASVALGRLKNIAVDADSSISGIGQIALDSCSFEIDYLQRYIQYLSNQSDGGRPRDDLSSIDSDAETDPKLEATQRRLKYRLDCVTQGLTGQDGNSGIKLLAKSPQQQSLISKIQASIDSLNSTVSDQLFDPNVLMRDLQRARNQMQAYLKPAATSDSGTPGNSSTVQLENF